jgi:hypothetical protein
MNRQPILRGTAALVAGNLVITLPNTATALENRDIIRFVITSTIDDTTPLGTTSITINGTTFPLVTKISNPVRID